MARLDRLGSGKEIAQISAVIGRTFSFEFLLNMSSQRREHLVEGVERLVGVGLANARGELPNATYTFKHALVQDAAYASLPRDRRRDLHMRLAGLLERSVDGGMSIEPELIAWHFSQGGAADRAIDYYSKAAELATGRFAPIERAGRLQKGLDQLKNITDSADKMRRELDLTVLLGRALIDHEGSGSEAVRTTFERARELCLALEADWHLLAVYDGLVMNYYFAHSDSEKIRGFADELDGIAGDKKDRLLALWALRMRAGADFLTGSLNRARAGMEEVLSMLGDAEHPAMEGHVARDPRVSTLMNLGICLTVLGYPRMGSLTSERGLRHAEQLDQPVSLISALRRASVEAMIRRDADAVTDFAGRLVSMNSEYETFVYRREGEICHGWAHLRSRDDPARLEHVLHCLEELDAARHWVMLPFFMISIAEVISEKGENSIAIGLINRAMDIIQNSGEEWCYPEALRIKSLITMDDHDDDILLLQQSLSVAQKQEAKLWELRSAATLARL